MTIGSNSPPRAIFNCDGVSKVFPVNIQAYQAGDFEVIHTTAAGVQTVIALNADYSLATSGSLSPTYWTLTTLAASAYPLGDTLQIFINPAQVQQTQYVQGQAFPSLAVQTNMDRLTQMVQRLQDEISRAIRAPDGDNAPQMLLPNAAARANATPVFDLNGNISFGVLLSTVLTQAAFNAFLAAAPLYAISATEITAGATVINTQYPVASVDRYATNTVPGSTSMVAAFNMAGKVAMLGAGRVTYGLTAPYNLDSPVNWTIGTPANYHGIYLENVGSVGIDAPDFGIIASHSGIVFDCTGNDSITTRHVQIQTAGSSSPKCAFFHARAVMAGNNSLQVAHERGRWIGSFSISPYYNYGAEDDVLFNCYFWNTSAAANTATRVYTGNNIKALTTSFATDMFGNALTQRVGAQSCIDHNDFGCQDQNTGGQNTSDCIYLEQADSFKKYGGWAYSANSNIFASGRSLIYVDLTNAASSYGVLSGLTGEQATYLQAYGLLFSNAPSSASQYIPVGWTVQGCKLPAGTYAIAAAGANTILDNFALSGTTAPVAGGVNIPGTLQNSPSFDFGNEMSCVIGTIIKSRVTGASEQLTYTTLTNPYLADTGSANKSFATGIVSGTNGWTLTGALAQSVKCCLIGNYFQFEINVGGATNIACTTGATITTLPFAAATIANVPVMLYAARTVLGSASINGKTLTMPAVTTTTDDIIISGGFFIA